jgi:hypothetical protein
MSREKKKKTKHTLAYIAFALKIRLPRKQERKTGKRIVLPEGPLYVWFTLLNSAECLYISVYQVYMYGGAGKTLTR